MAVYVAMATKPLFTCALGMILLSLGLAGHDSQVKVVDLIPPSMSGETNQDSEPFLAVNAGNPDVMSASAFTVNPVGAPDTAPIFVTRDGGDNWTLNSVVPSASATADISHGFDGNGKGLYASILALPMDRVTTLKDLVTVDVSSPALMKLLATRANVDQPWIQSRAIAGHTRVYVGLNDFGAPGGRTATVDVSVDGAAYTSHRIEFRSTAGQDAPSVRPAIAADGTVYAAFLSWTEFDGALATANVVVVRDDKGAIASPAFQDLVEPADELPGRIVQAGIKVPWSPGPALGQQRIGSTLSIAVDPTHSNVVYVAWGDRVGNGDIYTLHVRRSVDRGATWSSDLLTLRDGINVALAVEGAAADNPTVAVLYQQLIEGRWVTALAQSRDAFATRATTIVSRPLAASPARQFQPYLGDYISLAAVGDAFRGIFSASNLPDLANFPSGVRFQRQADFAQHKLTNGARDVAESIDPFYVSVPMAR
jgi:hypothetical protein